MLEPLAVVLVEGVSDQRALEALAERRSRDLAAAAVVVLPMGGAKNIGRYLRLYGPEGRAVRLAGLYDEGEHGLFRAGLERAGFGKDLTRGDMERLGFFECVEDLEDELIRSLGFDAVERVIEAQGDLVPFRTFERQPAQRGRTAREKLRRFMGTRSGRKALYARLLVDALDLDRVPRPLDGVLAHVS